MVINTPSATAELKFMPVPDSEQFKYMMVWELASLAVLQTPGLMLQLFQQTCQHAIAYSATAWSGRLELKQPFEPTFCGPDMSPIQGSQVTPDEQVLSLLYSTKGIALSQLSPAAQQRVYSGGGKIIVGIPAYDAATAYYTMGAALLKGVRMDSTGTGAVCQWAWLTSAGWEAA
ncbi:hypothetical protein OEZ85_014054 [Tetradesmus obliquus]|uniref:MEKHLA domain-containing protein n=1 Tax=Tetradesmus obliquus TaxID=3088 RepID=A0ABY8U722_TETOB|nr:hypothetical protein OEZ85_014054 [Tetradesmus obliquus]